MENSIKDKVAYNGTLEETRITCGSRLRFSVMDNASKDLNKFVIRSCEERAISKKDWERATKEVRSPIVLCHQIRW